MRARALIRPKSFSGRKFTENRLIGKLTINQLISELTENGLIAK
jgi:hypothetical protein